jgi:hypothetical protein
LENEKKGCCWKQALDCNEYIVSILMDLSKAFDCLPHEILICKLSAYGLSDNATKLLLSYLSNRKQQKNLTIEQIKLFQFFFEDIGNMLTGFIQPMPTFLKIYIKR